MMRNRLPGWSSGRASEGPAWLAKNWRSAPVSWVPRSHRAKCPAGWKLNTAR